MAGLFLIESSLHAREWDLLRRPPRPPAFVEGRLGRYSQTSILHFETPTSNSLIQYEINNNLPQYSEKIRHIEIQSRVDGFTKPKEIRSKDALRIPQDVRLDSSR
jgi:hypothetical protein